MRYWWVNQNQTFRQEIAGGYLWSPKRNAKPTTEGFSAERCLAVSTTHQKLGSGRSSMLCGLEVGIGFHNCLRCRQAVVQPPRSNRVI